MRTSLDLLSTLEAFEDSDEFDDVVTDSDLAGYSRPEEVASDPALTLERKRALLAHWASDIHALPNFPSLRSLARGVTVEVDEILEALRSLDTRVDPGALALHGENSVSQ
ncbi:MAG TPA: hypothetical protein VHB23_03725 [Devosiaceae bacterium]|nr:hypothetical protein [Devosiaceae bacterium]